MVRRPLLIRTVAILALMGGALAGQTVADGATPASAPSVASPTHYVEGAATSASAVGEKVPSDDPAIWNFHSLGLVNGCQNFFRSASPLRDFVKANKNPEDPAVVAEAAVRMKRLHDLGIRTIVSFEDPQPPNASPNDAAKNDSDKPDWVEAEKTAATKAGITFVSCPIANSGPNSLETMSDAQVLKLLDSVCDEIFKDSRTGGVDFHCAAGHDRAGVVTAFMRLKYQHWPVDQAIDEMRRYGHNWPKFSANGGVSSWHEGHLRGIAELLKKESPVALH